MVMGVPMAEPSPRHFPRGGLLVCPACHYMGTRAPGVPCLPPLLWHGGQGLLVSPAWHLGCQHRELRLGRAVELGVCVLVTLPVAVSSLPRDVLALMQPTGLWLFFFSSLS